MTTSLAVLLVEDSESDAQLIVRLLKKAGYDVVSEQVETAEQMRAAWGKRAWDIVISDYSLPQFDGRAALTFLRETGQDIPFIVVSGTIGEETAVAMMKAGAHDYLLKGNLARLTPAVERELAQAETRRERKRAEAALRESEQRFRSLFENMLDGFAYCQMLFDDQDRPLDFVYLAVNGAFERLTGLENVVGKHVTEVLPGIKESSPELFEIYGRVALTGKPERLEIDFKPLARWLAISVYSTEKGSFVAVFDNITERKAAEAALTAKNEEIKAMTQQLWQAARLATMGELAASVAHELNNPLGTVSLRVESLLSQMPAGDPGRRELEVVEQEVERMSTLVAHLLQFSRRGTPQISTVDVGEEIENTLELIHYHLRQRQITVQREFAPDVPMVPADRQQLRQLFLNLFTNAADAMPEGGTLTIRVSDDPARQRVLIEVADTGMGIAPEDLPKVTEPFFTTKPEGKGTGLGLAICRRIVQEHNGTFEIISAGTGQGTTVRLTLPPKNNSHEAFLQEEA